MLRFATAATLLLAIFIYTCSPPGEKPSTPQAEQPATFVGSASCQSCHAKAFEDWRQSDHFRAMQEPADSTVLGNFDNTRLVADGITSTFFRRDGKFIVNTQGEDGRNHDYEIAYTFGYFPLQQYLIRFPGGRMQPLRASWDAKNKKWFHQYGGQTIYHKDWLHWTGNGQNWNTMCANCHSTDLQKNYQFASDAYDTRWKEINVACESCHGPASRHVSLVQSAGYEKGSVANAGLIYGHDTLTGKQVQSCASCHTRKADISNRPVRTGHLMDDIIPQLISQEFYFPDGQIREEDYEYGSFTQSKMFQKNVRCSNCHQPHTGKLVKTGNDLCMSCHQPKYNTEAHHFHTVNTEGAQCVNCHMTTRTYMGNDVRRDHSFRVPRPDQSIVWSTPNACNGCHKEKTATWAADVIKKKFGPERRHHFSDDLLPGSQLNNKSPAHLVRLLADTLQPAIARATAAHYLGSMPIREAVPPLLKALTDREAMVRYYTLRVLKNFDPAVWINAAAPLLSDPVKAVRIATADLFHSLPPGSVPPAHRDRYALADAENKKYLQEQTDFSVGNIMLADYEMQGQDQVSAIAHYIRGLKKDSLMNYARLNLASAYSTVGKNPEALKTLQDAARIDPVNGRTFYNLGLLQYEMGDKEEAARHFDHALTLGSPPPGLFYNYGLLLKEISKKSKAEEVLLSGYRMYPRAENINYALCFLYLEDKKVDKARLHGRILKQLNPSNPSYQGLFRQLSL